MAYDGPERRQKSLTEADRDWITTTLKEQHRCPFNEEEIIVVKRVVDIVSSLGNGNLSVGVEKFREQSKFMSGFLSKKSIITGAAILSITGVIAIAAFKMVAAAIRELILTGGR